MPPQRSKPRLVVVSPFLDKRHGTERCVAEQIERLSGAYEIHLYSERVEEVDLRNITWHRVPIPPGPHLFRYIWWLAANHFCRWRDRRRGMAPDLVYSPGVNCADADVIAVHIVFAEFLDHIGNELDLSRNPLRAWPVLLHRRGCYYHLCKFLERRAYRNERVTVAAVSNKTAQAVTKYCGRKGAIDVVYYGFDTNRFNPHRRNEMRESSRVALGLPHEAFVVLLGGNDWKKKGLEYLLQAIAKLKDRSVRLLVAGHDSTILYEAMIQRLGIEKQVSFLPVRRDVEFYYAACDVYAGPSLDDSFNMPPAEAMACGLPVITSRFNGGCAIVDHNANGLILEDPSDTQILADWLERLAKDEGWRALLGDAAARTAAQYTWERNTSQMHDILERARIAKSTA